MTKKILWASLILALTFSSCRKDDSADLDKVISRELALSYTNNATTIRQNEAVTITVTGSQATTNPSGITWELNGKQVAKGVSYTFQPSTPGRYTLTVSSANRDFSVTREYMVEAYNPTPELSLNFTNDATTIQQLESITATATGTEATTNPSG